MVVSLGMVVASATLVTLAIPTLNTIVLYCIYIYIYIYIYKYTVGAKKITP